MADKGIITLTVVPAVYNLRDRGILAVEGGLKGLVVFVSPSQRGSLAMSRQVSFSTWEPEAGEQGGPERAA